MVTLFSNIEGAKEKLLSSLFSIDFKTFLSYVTLDRKKKSSLVLVTLELINIYIYILNKTLSTPCLFFHSQFLSLLHFFFSSSLTHQVHTTYVHCSHRRRPHDPPIVGDSHPPTVH